MLTAPRFLQTLHSFLRYGTNPASWRLADRVILRGFCCHPRDRICGAARGGGGCGGGSGKVVEGSGFGVQDLGLKVRDLGSMQGSRG